MSKSRNKDLLGNDCAHRQTIDDDREGNSVCLECGLVLEPIYQPLWQEAADLSIVERNDPIRTFLLDVAAHAEIPQSIVEYSMSYYNKIKRQLQNHQPKFSEQVLASYALYETLSRNNISRSVQEIEFFTSCKATKLWSVESALNLKETLNHPLDYVERFCNALEIKYQDVKIIKGIVGNMFGLGGIRPQCVVAVVIYLYHKETKNKLPLLKICEICNVSSTNIYAIIRRMKKQYAGKITLLYT